MPDSQGRRRGSHWLYLVGGITVLIAGILAFLLFTRQRSQVEAATEHLTAEGQKGPTVEVAIAKRVAGCSAAIRSARSASAFRRR